MSHISLGRSFLIITGICAVLISSTAFTSETETSYWMKIRAHNKFERTAIANIGVSIESVEDDYVIATGDAENKRELEKRGLLEVVFPEPLQTLDFPESDSIYHNYKEMTEKLQSLTKKYAQISRLISIGKTVEGLDIWSVRISGQLEQASTLPGSIFMGGHHAREHLSVEVPLYLIEYLLTEYANNAEVQKLVNARDIHIIPSVNPDGAEFDISTGKYKAWRKNRATTSSPNTFGVDLNRNYGYGWGGQGASASPTSDTYRGPSAFSEPETIAIKNYVETHENITVLLSYHTYGGLILYPLGNVYNPISDAKDKAVHEIMAAKMAADTGYKAMQSSGLYIASGDTTDWSYAELKIISFTFELEPFNGWGTSGFYPGSRVVPQVQSKNIKPALYLIENSANPYSVLN